MFPSLKFKLKCRKKFFPDILLVSIVAIQFIVYVNACTNYKKDTKIKLDKNGYRNIIIGIEDGVQENRHLIENIKTVFTQASEFLFNITKKRVYFKEIIILIPHTWKLDHYYDDFNTNSFDGRLPNTTWESYDKADFCIEERDDFTIDIPYVVNYASNCGDQASHINLTPDYFSYKNRVNKLYGPYANALIHQWAQFRYGVFSEYPHKITENNEEFYINSKGQIEATRCSSKLTGTLKDPTVSNEKCEKFEENGLPSTDCVFEDDVKQTDTNLKTGSLMYRYFLNQLKEFCDNDEKNHDTLHNKYAPTVQNKECNGQSIWEVLRSHEDFKDFKNMPNNQIKSTVPKFQLLKHRFKKIVLLIDKSIMNSSVVFPNVVKAINDYIKLMINDYDIIGIIHFENNAKVTLAMTFVQDTVNRNKIAEAAIPTSSNGRKSNIWNAISLGLTLLRTTLDSHDKISPTGGSLLIITNTLIDNSYPSKKKEDIVEQIKSNEIDLNLVRIANEQDETLEGLVKETDGLKYLLNDYNRILEIDDALINIANFETKNSNEVVEMVNSFFEINPMSNKIGHLFIDESISTKANTFLKFKFNIEKVKDFIEIIVYEPSNKKHQSKYNVKCKDSSLFFDNVMDNLDGLQEIVCEFKKPKYGKWIYEITNEFDQNIYVHLKINVYFHNIENEGSYYSNYYDREDLKKRFLKVKKSALPTLNNMQSDIKVEARWYKSELNYPERQKIFASISRGLKPILNASVKAIIYRPSGDYISLELHDNGLNADRFKDDGIYTRYFSNFITDGMYYARIDVKTHYNSRVNMQKLVGSPFLEHYPTIGVVNKISLENHLVPIEEISRTISFGSFILRNFNEEDLIKPSKIKDFYVSSIDTAGKVIKFTFTAPGDDGELGLAAEYEIKCSYDLKYLLDSDFITDDKITNTTFLLIDIVSASFDRSESYKPNQGGYKEFFVLNTSIYDQYKTISIKIRAKDNNQNYGEWSWPVTVKLAQGIELAPHLKQFISSSENQVNYQIIDNKKLTGQSEKYFSRFFIGFLAGLGIILAVHVLLLIALSIFKIKECKGNDIKPIRV